MNKQPTILEWLHLPRFRVSCPCSSFPLRTCMSAYETHQCTRFCPHIHSQCLGRVPILTVLHMNWNLLIKGTHYSRCSGVYWINSKLKCVVWLYINNRVCFPVVFFFICVFPKDIENSFTYIWYSHIYKFWQTM
jgi:hypothetical protein